MKTIVIIGAGFSGVALVAQLARQVCDQQVRDQQLRVVLVNRSGTMARGLAYGTRSPDHLLNVPAGNMSALADVPDHFVRYACTREPTITAHSFVARSLYGDYLESLLAQAQDAPNALLRLERKHAQVRTIEMRAGRRCVVLDDGQVIDADQVVLAFGHFAPAQPPLADPSFFADPRYIRDPWDGHAIDAIDRQAPVLVIGTGLTAIDTCLNLMKAAPTRPITLVSRRGLLPKAHRAPHPYVPAGALPESFPQPGASPRALLRAVRRHAREVTIQGQDWRDLLNSLRAHTHLYWQGWSEQDRRRFLRHLQPFWDNHRHRAAPGPHAIFEQALHGGHITVKAGRIVHLQRGAQQVKVSLRLRQGDLAEFETGYVINCIGPSSKLRQANNPLVAALMEKGLIRPDALGLGIAVDSKCRVLGADGQGVPDMFYIGPLLKAHYWEATAVPELRQFAARLAKTLLQAP